MKIMHLLVAIAVPALVAGCGKDGNQPAFAELHPVKGVVKRGGQPVKAGMVRFFPDPDKPDFIINSLVQSDGTFTLTTVRSTDSKGERKPGAPAGNYKVTYMPDALDQTGGGSTEPIPILKPVTVTAGAKEIVLELPTGKK